MHRTTDAVMPMAFLQVLRGVVPQFGERDRREGILGGYAQQGKCLFLSFFFGSIVMVADDTLVRCGRMLGEDCRCP